ncbi:hypothetical protein DENSPDRAFT_814242 [Dentipellis sp. KUC8613]|nr:hypothetical protein DENSPDRAFT_814242 [Dentipellis sp. KUC8613]
MPSSTTSDWRLDLYTFPSRLVLSNHRSIEHVLADIPPLSVGLLGFAALTFFLIMKKTNLALVFLFTSVLFTFFAAILDIGQGLTRGKTDFDLSFINQLIIAREVLYGIAVGFRFLFFWAFVARPPRGEVKPSDASTRQDVGLLAMLLDTQGSHSGSWARWGVIGHFLRWIILGLSVSIVVLQILWRLIRPFNRFGPVYEAESTIEIIASAILITKLILNTVIAATPSRMRTLYHYSFMFLALFINLGVGVGNIIQFAFSESTAGRFLSAVEVYIVILFMLVTTFYPITPPELSQGRVKRASSFKALRLTGGVSFLGDRRLTLGLDGPAAPTNNVDPTLEGSRSKRLSSWLIRRTSGIAGRFRPALERDEVRLWNQDEAERGNSPTFTEKDAQGSLYQQSPVTSAAHADEPWRNAPQTAFTVDTDDARSAKPTMNAAYDGTGIPTWNADMDSPIIQQFSPRSSELYGGTSRIGSVYDVQTAANMLTIPPSTYGRSEAVSPIYGLNGTLRGGRYSPYTANPPTNFDIPSTRSSGLENLFREQSEIEKSIAALRLLASSPADPRSSQAISVASERGVDPEFMTVPPRSGPESASVRSEFSLSSFPQPPEARRSSRSKSMLSVELLPPRMPAAMTTIAEMQSLPSSARNSEDTLQLNIGQGGRFESAGTQFDVTSFIEGKSRHLWEVKWVNF